MFSISNLIVLISFKLFTGVFISSIFFGTLLLNFIITGILAFDYYSGDGIISTKKILKLFTRISLVAALVITLIMYSIIFIPEGLPKEIVPLFFMAIGVYFGMFIAVFIVLLTLLLVGFGLIGITVAIQRGVTPELLLHISRISTSKAKQNKNEKKIRISRLETIDKVINWLFVIPDVLETKALRIKKGRSLKNFPWPNFQKAIFWQLLLGTVIIINISLNPL